MSEDSIEFAVSERKTRQVIREGLTIVMKTAKPVGEHVVRWILISLGILLFMFELDSWMNGKIFSFLRWIWTDLVGAHPTVSWFIGVLSYHFALRHKQRRFMEEQHPMRRAMQTAELVLDKKALTESAERMGVKLVLDNDPKPPEKPPNAPK